MKFKFKEHRDITALGVFFPAGEFVEVEDKAIVKKLKGNSHFVSRDFEDAVVDDGEPDGLVDHDAADPDGGSAGEVGTVLEDDETTAKNAPRRRRRRGAD